jgi:adenine-specific DNA-methyltransferase
MATKVKRKKPTAKADVESYKHDDAKRKNIPTAENQKLVADEDKAVQKLRWKRNPDLDPQLVWRGKDFESDPLEVDAPPIYIQEKIKPSAIIEDLRKQSKERSQGVTSQLEFFHDFNGLPEGWKEDATESYYHDEGNWQNRMILGDSLLVMASLSKREDLRGKVQCIYIDPPYGIRFNSNWQPSTKSKDVRDGQANAVSREPEVIRAFRDTWKDEIHSYVSYLRDRLIVARDLLAETGSIFVQIGEENTHLIRSLLDEVFGPKNLCTSIVISKTVGQTADILPNVADYVIWYAKDRTRLKYRPLLRLKEFGGEGVSGYRLVQMPNGSDRPMTAEEKAGITPLPSGNRAFGIGDLTSQRQGRPSGEGSAMAFPIKLHGREFRPSGTRGWSTTQIGIERLAKAGRISTTASGGIGYVRFFDDFRAFPLTNIWSDTVGQSQYGGEKIYVVQTAVAVVERCILLTTDPGDLVLDPTCGSGTTAYVSEQWGRRWITIDTSRVALTLSRARLMGAKYDYYLLKDSKEGAAQEGDIAGKPPLEGPFTNNIRHGFVYEGAPHVTLKSIANNAEVDVIWDHWQKTLEPLRENLNKALKQSWEEWQVLRESDPKWPDATKQLHAQWWEARRSRQQEIDHSIARNADIEYLYDRPYKARGVVRVAGPFTVESLSPHRVLPMGEDPYLEELLAADEDGIPPSLTLPRKGGANGEADTVREKDAGASGTVITDFTEVVFENLKTAGVQNTKKGERLMLENLRPFASRTGMIQFQGEYREKGASKRAAVCIGPEYDTVGYDLVRRTAREAVDLFDTLIVCGFAFAPEVDDTRLNFGGLSVLKARMNQDLRMADKLKATGAGNLFVVFGEPDIEIKPLPGNMLQVEIRGMDIFDPTTGEVRSSGGSELLNDVAAWFVDHDYDEESFFVRQAYFVGTDPYDGLKRALNAQIDETAWAELNSTVSHPFPKPPSGRICVKVINHFGDEVQKVFSV